MYLKCYLVFLIAFMFLTSYISSEQNNSIDTLSYTESTTFASMSSKTNRNGSETVAEQTYTTGSQTFHMDGNTTGTHYSNVTLFENYLYFTNMTKPYTTSDDQYLSTETMITDELLKSDKCLPFGTCSFVSTLEFQYCKCDDVCIQYGDCCVDVDMANKTYDSSTPQFECSPHTIPKKIDGIFIMKHCPSAFTGTEIDIKCRNNDIMSIGPFVADEYGNVYQNKFCAQCHDKKSFQTFSIKISNLPNVAPHDVANFTNTVKLDGFINHNTKPPNNPVVEQIPPEGMKVRYCVLYEEVVGVVCQNYSINPVVVGIMVPVFYRNQFCLPPDSSEIRCIADTEYFDQVFNIFPLSVIFSFKTEDEPCINVVKGICIEEEMYHDYQLLLGFAFVSTVLLTERQKVQLLLTFAWNLPSFITFQNIDVDLKRTVGNETFITQFSMETYINKNMYYSDMVDTKNKLRTFRLRIKCTQLNGPDIEIHTIGRNATFAHSTYKVQNSIEVEMKNANVDISFSRNGDVFCGNVFIEGSFVNYSSLILKRLVCMEDSVHVMPIDQFVDAKTIITFAGMGVSVIALGGSLILYRVTGMCKTIPGSNVENLSMSLLLSNVLFMVGVGANDYQIICYIIGVILHYLWLTVFSFMTISLLYMFNNLRKMSSNSVFVRKANRRTHLTFLGVSVPLPFVVPAILLENLHNTDFAPNYGAPVCFPTGYPANLVFVSAPIGLAVITNVTCLIGIAVGITRQSIASRHIRKSTSYKHVSIFARISVVTGVFWISGILGAVFPNDLNEYLFITSCSLQGFFVAVANLSSRRAFQSIKEYFRH